MARSLSRSAASRPRAPGDRAWWAGLVLVALSGCDQGASVVAGRLDATLGGDAREDARADRPPSDAPSRDGSDLGAPDECARDLECPRGWRCLQGNCAPDVCISAEHPCGDERCELRCVPTRDHCAGVRCPADETCFSGRCVPGCFPAPCAGVTCPAGQFCHEGTGRCAAVTPCPGPCDEGYACHVGCFPHTPCDGVTCGEGEFCVEGRCVPNLCAGVTCPAGALCIEGRCTPTCGCDPPCDRSPRDRCVAGRCVCARRCQPDTPCGADDGCGGRCVGPCANPFAACDPVIFSCQCASRCNPSGACGDDDGCGGRCDQGCALGERCDTALRRCICVSRCPGPERAGDFPCGADVPNECEGGPSCGRGTGCPAGARCNSTTWQCECEGACSDDAGSDGGGGGPIGPSDGGGGGEGDGGDAGPSDGDLSCPPELSPCGGRCVNTQTNGNHCGSCGARCPYGTTCTGGVCRCPAPLTLCGERCVNTANDDAHCGGCGTVCAPRTACEGGRCRCIPSCVTDPRSVACGEVIPNACPGEPSCGVGLACGVGERCDPVAGRCVCVPQCPPGVRCGSSDGCGGQCVGTCDAGTCTRDAADPRRFFCSEASCVDGCRCDEVCTLNRCVPVTCPGGGFPCPCQCCPLGTACVGGSACVPIPP